MAYYSRAHYRLLANGGPDTPGTIAERQHRQTVLEQVRQEVAERWPSLNETNVLEVLRWQEARIKELLASWGKS